MISAEPTIYRSFSLPDSKMITASSSAIPEPSPEFADIDGIKKLVTVFFFGHLCKMFNIKNDYAQMYDDEVSKYTVSKPQISEAIDEEDDRAEALFREARAVPDQKDTDGDG